MYACHIDPFRAPKPSFKTLPPLQVGASAMTSGLLQPLGGDHSLVLAAAQLLAQKASLVEAKAQVCAP